MKYKAIHRIISVLLLMVDMKRGAAQTVLTVDRVRYEVRNNYIKSLTNLEVGFLLFQFLQNKGMLKGENI
jgi:hypothetical protein